MLTNDLFDSISLQLNDNDLDVGIFIRKDIDEFFQLNPWIDEHLINIQRSVLPFFKFLYYHLSVFNHSSLFDEAHHNFVSKLDSKFKAFSLIKGRALSVEDYCCALMFPNILEAYNLDTECGLDDLEIWIRENGERCFVRHKPDPKIHELHELSSVDVNIFGLFAHSGGIGEDARQFRRLLQQLPLKINSIDLNELAKTTIPQAKVNFFVGPVHVCYSCKYQRPDLFGLADTNVCFAPWELEKWPRALSFCCDAFDLILASSDFILNAFDNHCKVQKITMPFDFNKIINCAQGVIKEKKAYKFFYSYDGRSYPARKNPWVAIEAFLKVKEKRPNAKLTVKAHEADDNHNVLLGEMGLSGLRHELEGIDFITKYIDENEFYKLFASHNCLLMPSASEGFGRLAVEARILGLDLISQDYSGMTEYMDCEGCYPVEYKYVPVGERYPFNDNCFWSEPDLDKLVEKMLFLIDESLYQGRLSKPSNEIKERYADEKCLNELRDLFFKSNNVV